MGMGPVGLAPQSSAENARGALGATRKHRVPALDGLRAVAIVLVISLHAFSWPVNGHVGVDLFFVLSGFLITTILLDEREATGRVSLRQFYLRRARRLLPALVVMLVCCLLVASAIHDAERLQRASLSSLYGLTFMTNIVMVWTQWPHSYGLDHLWSLAQEEQFYLVWPLALLLLARRRLEVAAAVLALAAAAVLGLQFLLAAEGASGSRIEFGPDTRSIGIILGCLFAVMLRTRAATVVTRASRPLAPLAVVVMAFVALHRFHDVFVGGTALFAVASAMVLTRVLDPGSWLGAALGIRPVAYLGRISYSLYLWHYPVLISAGFIYGGIATRLGGIGLALLAAIGSYHLVERPFLRPGTPTREAREALRSTQTARLALVSMYLHHEVVS